MFSKRVPKIEFLDPSLEFPNIEKSRLLRELALLNKRRKEIINDLMTNE